MMVRASRIVGALLAALVLVFLVSQWRAIHTENVNWDEFGLLSRATATARTGRVQGGGRPGLATLMLIPFVERCTDSVQAVVSARKLWLAFTVAYLAAVFALVAGVTGRGRDTWQGPALAVALIALVPVFLRWSLQVRTDQPALMFACWGGVLLLASLQRRALAAAAGVLFALGYLSSQKAVYIAALSVVLLLLRVVQEREGGAIDWRRAVQRLAITATGGLAGLAIYSFVISSFYSPPPPSSLRNTFSAFAFYRAAFGFRAYEAMLPTLVPHLLLVGVATAALLLSIRRPVRARAALLGSGLVLIAGLAVGRFHAGAFPYFWMTLGVFPAIAIGLALDGILEVFGARLGRGLVILAVCLLLVQAGSAVTGRDDTQQVQRRALAFIDRNFDAAARGFHTEGALLCRRDPSPFPVYFADTVSNVLGGVRGRLRAQAFIDEFRNRPVSFMITQRLYRFPAVIDAFWNDHYVDYRDEVMIPGRRISGARNDGFELDVIVPGPYRWRTAARTPARLALGARQIEDGGVVTLGRGSHRFVLLDDVTSGLLTLSVGDEPQPGGANFYDPVAVHELDPLFPRF